MSSSIRLTSSGAPETPPLGYARIFVEEYSGKLQLKMIRPDGSIEVFGTIGTPLEVEYGGTGLSDIPEIGEFLIGTGTGYRLGQIVAGSGVSITKTATNFEISTDISNIELQMPPEFSVLEQSTNDQNAFVVSKTEQVKNSVYIAPATANGIPTFRFLQVEDLPDLPISKIINLVETIRAESLLIPVDSADIDHAYDTTAKTLSSTIKPTTVTSGSYGSATQIPTFNVRADGRLDAANAVSIAIPHTQITDFKEASEDVIGELVENSTSINVEYDDYSNYLKFHVNEEYLITTNISATENQRAPTSQAVKQYVDDLVDAERTARVAEDAELQTAITALETEVGENLQQALQNINTSITNEVTARTNADTLINQRLDTFFANAPELLDTITEIDTRFNEVELAITQGAAAQAQALQNEAERIDGDIEILQSAINEEINMRATEIQRVYDSITAHRESFNLTPTMISSSIPLVQVQQLTHIMPNSVVAFIDRLGLFEGLDFNLSMSNNQVVLTFTADILNIIDGSEVLRISYLTKI